MVFFQLDSISRKILLTANMPEYIKVLMSVNFGIFITI